jgi:aminomethyltransferase
MSDTERPFRSTIGIAPSARMVSFAGYAMPIQYEGIMTEHRWTRNPAGLFDVSHMASCSSPAPRRKGLEALLPADIHPQDGRPNIRCC